MKSDQILTLNIVALGPEKALSMTRDRGFESVFLQR
jgi:hypothetical protein